MAEAIALSIVLSFAAIVCVVPGGLIAIARQELPKRSVSSVESEASADRG
jgi:hypothetical protein